jgi:superfamily II DNA or RNA helicase
VLDILEHYVAQLNYSYLRLDGQTPVSERQEMIDQFNTDPSVFIFLLSTRAGGLGINLATADTAVFYDISFNPQVDRQAEDRCHRLGQEKQVRIYKLIAEGSIDEHMLKMAVEKKELNDVVLEEGEYDGNVKDSEADVLNDTRDGVEQLFDVMFNASANGHANTNAEKSRNQRSTPNTSQASEHNNNSGSELFTLEGSLILSDDEDAVQLNGSDDVVVLD